MLHPISIVDRKPQHTPALKTKWLTLFLALYGLFVFLPFAAPLMMKWNLPALGKPIYFVYSFVCHQLPQRSLFFFGPRLMYSVSEIQAAWQVTDNPMILRQFIGNPEMGWKVAWSDRMISMYGGIWVAGLLWAIYGKRDSKTPLWVFLALTLPMVLDGTTHLISDFNGVASGFRYTNDWLATLTRNSLPASFYVGDALGSFNSWARWLSGLLFGFGMVWWSFPFISESLDLHARSGLRSAEQH
ncbi:MAG TPA: DUF2085 domain-containing protein [Anaerolineales bacterium]|nr:DUF2085 domain-containing protein [Anaerolineales bacterium]